MVFGEKGFHFFIITTKFEQIIVCNLFLSKKIVCNLFYLRSFLFLFAQ